MSSPNPQESAREPIPLQPPPERAQRGSLQVPTTTRPLSQETTYTNRTSRANSLESHAPHLLPGEEAQIMSADPVTVHRIFRSEGAAQGGKLRCSNCCLMTVMMLIGFGIATAIIVPSVLLTTDQSTTLKIITSTHMLTANAPVAGSGSSTSLTQVSTGALSAAVFGSTGLSTAIFMSPIGIPWTTKSSTQLLTVTSGVASYQPASRFGPRDNIWFPPPKNRTTSDRPQAAAEPGAASEAGNSSSSVVPVSTTVSGQPAPTATVNIISTTQVIHTETVVSTMTKDIDATVTSVVSKSPSMIQPRLSRLQP